jgi:hypothetical protein
MHSQTKRIDLHSHFIKEKYEDGTICVSHVPSLAQRLICSRNLGHHRLLFEIDMPEVLEKYHSKIHSLKP